MQASEVRIWVARPAAFGAAECDALRPLLDDEERARGDHLRAEADRRAHTVAHALCRTMLGQALGQRPEALRFRRDAHGKPALQGAGSELFFSLSHTRGWVACAASFGGPLGLDVEAIDADAAQAELLDLFLHPLEPGVLQATGAAAFYASWTALEAYWKARGTGLSSANPRLRLARPHGWLEAALEGDASRASRLFITPVDVAPEVSISLACGWTPTLQLTHWHPCAPAQPEKCDKRSFQSRGNGPVVAFS